MYTAQIGCYPRLGCMQLLGLWPKSLDLGDWFCTTGCIDECLVSACIHMDCGINWISYPCLGCFMRFARMFGLRLALLGCFINSGRWLAWYLGRHRDRLTPLLNGLMEDLIGWGVLGKPNSWSRALRSSIAMVCNTSIGSWKLFSGKAFKWMSFNTLAKTQAHWNGDAICPIPAISSLQRPLVPPTWDGCRPLARAISQACKCLHLQYRLVPHWTSPPVGVITP